MFLRNLHTLESDDPVDIHILSDKIVEIGCSVSDSASELNLRFGNAIVYPGLINSHDHLEFNLFPQLGNRLYRNYVEWGYDIHRSNKDVINMVERIPLELRVEWGVYKNLLNGVTTVVNHGPILRDGEDLITVFEEYHFIHSIRFHKNWKQQLNWPFKKKQPFVVHIGEGVDADSEKEIRRLVKWNLFNRELIGVHAIAMDAKQASRFMGLVWCPASNYFLMGKTAVINELKKATKIVFGTDSTLTATWNLWDHIRMIRNEQFATDGEIVEMLTTQPASLWQMNDRGKLEKGHRADIVVARKPDDSDWLTSFFCVEPETILMVISNGAVRLFDEELLPQLDMSQFPIDSFSKIFINGACKYVYGDLPELMNKIHTYYPDAQFPIETKIADEAHC